LHFYQKNIADFNNATRHLTRVERSLFSDAIELYYDTEKPLTLDFDRLCRLLLANSVEEKSALRDVLNEFFIITDDGYFNKRCNEEILKYQAYMNGKSKAGKASAEQRAKHKSTPVEQTLNTCATDEQLTNTQYPIPINQYPITNITPIKPKSRTSALDDGFEEFWNFYPKKVGKDKAIIAWKKKKPKVDTVLKALNWQKQSDQWTKNDGQFIPNPTTYINEGRWQDEPTAERMPF
jgi:uncharacterized protein YdaU (DUF1376 family)